MGLSLVEYRNGLRNFIKDHADLNRLLKFEEENANDMLDLYLSLALGFLNAMPPLVVSYDVTTFPLPSLLIHQATFEALLSNQILQSRNDLTYNNGGITVKISDKERYNLSLQWLDRMLSRELDVFQKIKVSLNIDNAWGNVGSPYAQIHGNLPIKPNSIL